LVFELLLKQPLHSSNPPKTSSEDDVATDRIKAVGRKVIEGAEKRVGNVGLLIFCFSKEDAVVDLIGYELEPQLFYRDGDRSIGSTYSSILVFQIVQLLLSNALQQLQGDFLVHQGEVISQELV
jgi:hypothetical protein